jgi:hypothetical protein
MEEQRKIPSRKQPPSLVDMLDEACDSLRENHKLNGIAGDLEQLREAITGMLELTRFNDCLFGDEIRNFLQVKHYMKPRRGSELDPLLGQRQSHRKKK